MNSNNYSKQVLTILKQASIIKDKLLSTELNTGHLIFAMYEAEDTICRFLLQENKINMDQLLKVYYEIESTEECFQEILNETNNVAIKNKSKYIFDEHLFYTILIYEQSIGYQMLEKLGLDIEQLLEDIEDIFSFDLYEEELTPFLINLSQKEQPKYIDRNNYLAKIGYILNKKQKNNPLLIGNAGVGKTAIVEGLASIYQEAPIYQLNLGAAVANTKYRGELEEKIIKVVEFLKDKQAVLFIDEIHNVVGAGSNDGSLDIANLIKPYLARSDIKCIGATTLEEYYKYIAKDKALTRRFQNIYIDEPTKKETKKIIDGIIKQYEDYHQVHYSQSLIDQIIEMSGRYLPTRTFPDKAIDIIDEVGARAKQTGQHDLQKIAYKVIQDMTGISCVTISKLRKLNLNYPILKKYYLPFIILEDSKLPHLFVAKVNQNFDVMPLINDLEKVFCFKKEMYLELDLESYNEVQMLNNLIGSAKGYVGYEQGGIISEHLIKYPIPLIYFKNFDLAHYSIKNYLEKLFTSKQIVDNKGRTINLLNAIFLFDSIETAKEIGLTKPNSLPKNIKCDLKLSTIINQSQSQTELLELLEKYRINILAGHEYLNKNTVYEIILCGKGNYNLSSPTSYQKIN